MVEPVDSAAWRRQRALDVILASEGLQNGDVLPLKLFIEKYRSIPEALAMDIAECLGPGPAFIDYRLELVGRSRRTTPFKVRLETLKQRLKIGLFLAEKMHEIGKGGYESAVRAARDQFDISAGTVEKAWAVFRGVRDGTAEEFEATYGDVVLDEIVKEVIHRKR